MQSASDISYCHWLEKFPLTLYQHFIEYISESPRQSDAKKSISESVFRWECHMFPSFKWFRGKDILFFMLSASRHAMRLLDACFYVNVHTSLHNCSVHHKKKPVSGADPAGFLERGFKCIKVGGFALLNLSIYFYH